MEEFTLGELRRLVDTTAGKKIPTASALRESGVPVVALAEVGNGVLTVYKNGFFTYSVAGHTTVYAVDRCTGYAYDGGMALGVAFFENEEWTLRLMLAGEDRLEHNGNRREEKPHGFSLDEEGSDRGWGDGVDFTLRIEDRDTVNRMLPMLTDRQRQIVEMYFVQGLTQQQIADYLMIRKQVVCRHIQAAIDRFRCFLEKL
jgi:RNA polymerase sigma factor (sigma-70 family)